MPERARELAELLVAAGGGAGLTGFFGWLQKRTSNKAENQAGEAAILGAATRLQEIMNDAAKNQVASLREDLEAMRGRIEHLEGELREERQRSQSLESILRRNGYDLAAATEAGAFTVIEPATQTATVTPPRRRRRKP